MTHKSNALKLALGMMMLMNWQAVIAQTKPLDSAKKLSEVVITTWGFQRANSLRSTSAEVLLTNAQLKNQQQHSLVDAINTVPGVRMEERSPGSYRLSIRGSLVRSPFGIRNVKIYLDDFPLTDAGGNTYLNLIDPASIYSMTLLKGPQSSVLGANTGGALLINTASNTATNELSFGAGSYGLLHQTAKIERQYQNYHFSVAEGYQKSDGYRENSGLSRKYIQTTHVWDYSKRGQLKAFAFYSDLQYETPGGLTEAQAMANRSAARPATATVPGAVTQQAGIYNQTFYGGLLNRYDFTSALQYVIAVFGSTTDFKNPFLTNYEIRDENNVGLRTFLNYKRRFQEVNRYEVQLGLESSRAASKIKNYGNDKGNPVNLMANDNLAARQHFAFLKMEVDWRERLFVELGGSLNLYGYSFESFLPAPTGRQRKNLRTQLMPKIAASYLINKNLSVRSSISKGYSPPTLAEFRASDNVINTSLAAEAGWNYEAGFGYQSPSRRFSADGNLYFFQLENAIVRRVTASDAEYFINAGGTEQLGSEFQFSWLPFVGNENQLFNRVRLGSSFSYTRYRFDSFQNAGTDFSGNAVTGVPKQTLVNHISTNIYQRFFAFAQHSFVSSIPLNDANTVYSSQYHLIDLKAGIRELAMGSMKLSLSLGVNNVFNRQYSLGNDLNALGSRYYNPAAGRNYFTKLSVVF